MLGFDRRRHYQWPPDPNLVGTPVFSCAVVYNLLLAAGRDCNNHESQQWYFDGLYIRYKANTQKCLDIETPYNTDGARLQIW